MYLGSLPIKNGFYIFNLGRVYAGMSAVARVGHRGLSIGWL